MCVTNTTSRRPQPISLNPQQITVSQSSLSQRLLNCSVPTLPVKGPLNYQNEFSFTSEFGTDNNTEKARPKRRRKHQKPGKTAKNNDRHFVVHNYHDHAYDHDDSDQEESEDANQRRRGGVSIAFPLKLHQVLDQVEADGLAHVISWQDHGRAFVIHNPKEFIDHIMPK